MRVFENKTLKWIFGREGGNVKLTSEIRRSTKYIRRKIPLARLHEMRMKWGQHVGCNEVGKL
jgi:hypothetical protein